MMRKLIYIMCLLLPLGALGQSFIQRTNGTFTPVDPFLSVPRALYIPKVCDTLTALNGGKDTLGAIILDTCSHKLWIRDGIGAAHRWIEAKGSTACNVALGANNNGSADASGYVQSLINSGCKVIYFPSGTYLFNSTVQMKDSVTIIGDDKNTIIKVTKNIPAFKCGWALGGNKTTFRNLSFLGTYPQDSTSQDGIFSDSCNGILINNISAMKMAGWAIHLKNNGFCCSGYPLPTAVLGNLTSDCFIDSSYGGIFHDIRGEFNSAVNCTVVRGKYGIYTSAGSSRIEACNLSGTDYGVVITGGPNNAHGTMVGTHIAHSRRMGLYVTGASNGYEIVASNIRQDSILIENSDNIRFTACELGALDDAIVITNSTNTIFSFNRIWGSNPFGAISSGTKMLTADSATNGLSIVDMVRGKRLDISQIDGLVDFTGTGISRIRMINDTLNFSNSGTRHVVAGGENSIDSLHLTSTTSASKGRIKFGFNNGMVFNEATGNLGLGTSNPNNAIDIFGPGVKNINVQFSDATGHSRMTFNGVNGAAGAQFLFGNSTSPFIPDGFLISSLSGSLALANQNGDIRITKSTTINGLNEHARFTNAGSFLFSTTTDAPSKGRFQINSMSRFDSTMHINNMPAPPGAYNFMVKSTTDSGLYQIPVPGANTQILFNNAGTIAGDNGFTWNNTFKVLTINNTGAGAGIVVNSPVFSEPFTATGNQNGFLRMAVTNANTFSNAAAGGLYTTDNSVLQYYAGSSTNSFVPGGVLFRSGGPGGLNIVADASGAPIAFGKDPHMGVAEHARFLANGNFGIGVIAPTATLHIKASSGAASTAPIKLSSGTNLATPEDGAIEYNGTDYFVTSGGVRYTLNKSLTGSASLDFGSTAAQTSTDLTITVTGAQDGDVVVLGVPNASVSANSSFTAWVSGANTVTVRFNNYSASPIDPTSGTFKVRVIQ